MNESATQNPFAIWHGIPRSTIKWAPIIDEDKCTGCGMCVVNLRGKEGRLWL